MNWKFWKKKQPVKAPSVTEISSRLRGFLLDSQMPSPHDLAEYIGCSPISNEVAEMEEGESDKRVDEIALLTPLLYAFAHALAEASTEQNRTSSPELKSLPDEVWTHSRKLVEQIGLSTLIGSLSQLHDMGLIQIHPALRRNR